MCSKATCRACGKTTWAGCGMHVKQVMRDVPTDQQCTCGSTTARTAASATSSSAPSGRLRSLFRR